MDVSAAKKNDNILLKNVLLKLNSLQEGHLYANRLFHCLKRLPFQFVSCGIRMQIPIVTGVESGCK